MQAINGAGSKGLADRFRAIIVAGLLGLAGLWPALAMAQTSVYCPTPLTATVAWGGSVTIDVTSCHSGFGGVSGPFAPLPQHGEATLTPGTGGPQWVTYAHHGITPAGGGSDTIWLEDDNEPTGTIRVNVTIAAPTSAITVSPSALPVLTAGSVFSQTLTSAGGTAPYSYTLQSGSLPVGLSLTSAGLLSGTPTQRGGYSFSVRSTDNIGQTADKGYTGTVQNPTLTLASASGTAVQGVAFSQTLTTTGGVAPHTYQLETGALPAGISVSSAGVVSGTTSAAPASYPVTLRVTDASTGAGSYFELENYTLTVSAPPSVSIAVAPASVSEDGATNLVYTVTRSLNLASPTVVNITASGTATSGSDYTGGAATVTIPAGATTATITLDPTVDGTVEADETAILTVAAGTGYTVGSPNSATGNILNDDVPSATLSVSPAAVTEDGAANLVYTVTLNQAAPSATSVNFTVGGTATSGTDYAVVPSPLVIPAGSTTGTLTVNPNADANIEADETVVFTLSAGAGYTVGTPNVATGTLINDDVPVLTINDVTANEGNAGTTNYTFTVSLGAPAGPGGVSFDIATATGTATSGTDYLASSLTGQSIPAGSSTYTFTVQVNGDALNESSETFFVNVTNVVNAMVIDGQGVGTIVNDDPPPSLSIVSRSVVERNALTQSEAVQVTLNAASGQTITVGFATANGTATAGSDYVATSGTLTFAPGATTQVISVGIIGDTVPESDETFTVTLSGATNATVATATATITILNDDVPVTVNPPTLANGTVAVAYSQTLTASGGLGPYTFDVSAGTLPPGLSLSSAGALSGTPTAGGTYNFTVTVTDSSPLPGPFSGSRAYTLVIQAPTIALPPTSLAGGSLGAPYAASITAATGGTAPYSYAVTAGALPTGLTLNAASGAISGTPSAIGTFNFSVTATDSSTGSGPYTATQGYSIVVIDMPPAANAVSITVAYGSASNPVTLNITGGTPTSVAIATAPSHGTAIASGTSITYTPTAGYAGPDSFTYTATNSGGTSAPATVSVTIADPVITITAAASLNTAVAAAHTQTFTFSGGTQPWSGYQVTNLPAGLAITGTTANSVTVSGTPTQAGVFALNVSATDSSTGNGPYSVGQVFNLTVAAPTLSMAPAAGTLSATYASAFSQTFTAAGGVGPYTYLVSGVLPAGLSFSGGVLSGTPTVPGSYPITVTATDGSTGTGAPYSIAQNYTIDVSAPSIVLDPVSLPNPVLATAYSHAITASGGAAPYTFAVTAGTLPAGISLASGGALSGSTTSVGSFNFVVTATDAHGQTGSRAYNVTVAAPTLTLAPAAGTLTLAYAAPYSQAFTAGGGSGSFSYALSAGALPAGMTFSGNTLSGTPTVPGSYAITITATDIGVTGVGAPFSIAQNYTLDVPAPVIVVDPATLPNTTAGLAYSHSITASGGAAPYTFAVTAGALPTGMALSGAGVLSGTTTASGTFNFTLTATDLHGQTASRAYSVVVAVPTVTLTPATLPGGVAGTAYSQTLTIAGGNAPYTVTQAGALPTGLGFNAATRTFSGTPTQSGTFNVSVTVTDSTGGTAATVTNNYVLVIAAPTLTLTPASVPAATAGTAYSQSFVASGGIAPYAYAVSAGALPAGLVLNTGTGALSGTPTVAGSFNFSVTATDSTTGTAGTVTHAYTLVVSAPAITVNPPVLPAGVEGVPYTHVLTAVGGTAPHTFAVTAGALPGGLVLSVDGRLSGEPVAGMHAFTITATDALGFTGTRAYTVEVVARPDPSRDPEVRGLLEAQADSARRFASAQMGNFHQRLENLHDNREGAQLSNRLSFVTSQKCADYLGRQPGEPCTERVAANGPVAGASASAPAATDGAAGNETAGQGASGSAFATWIGGVIRSGNQDGRGGGARVDFETDGVSVGADRRFGPAFALGAGLGYGRDKSDVGDNGSRVEGDAYAMVLYASYHPGDRYFLDALAGYQRLSYDLRRRVTETDGFVHGTRDGDQWFGSVSAGAQFQRDTWQFTPYARVDVSQATLDGYVEQGDPVYSLAYGEQDVEATTGNLGLRVESRHAKSWGVFAPQARLEYQHDFNGDSSATMQYADLLTGPLYRAELVGFDRSRFMVGVGAMFYLARDFTLRAEYRGLFGNDGDRDNGLMLNFEKSY